MYKKNLKRFFDIIFSVTLIILLFPIFFFLFFLVWIFIGFPIFKQKRPGLNNKIFTLYKLKTLYDVSEHVLDDKRQSKFGNFLRRTGLDELPQLLNILKNDMSFIGPRPLLTEYLDSYSDYEKKRHLVKPGITGLAQIYPDPSGIKSWKKSIKIDIIYIQNISFTLDMKILFKTLIIILFRKKQYKDFKKIYE